MFILLKLISDVLSHQYRNLIESLAVQFELSDSERKELSASGNLSFVDNRLVWVKTYFKKKSGVIISP